MNEAELDSSAKAQRALAAGAGSRARSLLAVLALAGAGAQAQVPPAAANPGSAANPNLLVEAARGLGVVHCLPAITRLAGLAVLGARSHEVLVDWDRAHPDAGPFFGVVGVNYGPASVAATVTAVPDPGGGCTIAAERISVAPYTCESVAAVELKEYTATRLLPTFTVYTLRSDPGASVSLIDSPPGCLVMRRHVQYNWKEPADAAGPRR